MTKLKTCIWCNKSTPEVKFRKKAHIVPQSLNSTEKFPLECDECNHYFGCDHNKKKAMDFVLKEALILTKSFLGAIYPEVREQIIKSTYFNINRDTNSYELKNRFKLRSDFQKNLGHQLRRILIKVGIEKLLLNNPNFEISSISKIRDFVRLDVGEYPIYYLERIHRAVLTTGGLIAQPKAMLSINHKEI